MTAETPRTGMDLTKGRKEWPWEGEREMGRERSEEHLGDSFSGKVGSEKRPQYFLVTFTQVIIIIIIIIRAVTFY